MTPSRLLDSSSSAAARSFADRHGLTDYYRDLAASAPPLSAEQADVIRAVLGRRPA